MSRQSPPGPPGRLLTGNLSQLAGNFLGFLRSTARDYGDVTAFRAGPQRMVLLSHPDHIHDVLVGRADLFHKTRSTKRLLNKFLGDGLISLEGMLHRQHRRLMQPAFHARRIEIYVAMMVEDTLRMLESWRGGDERDIAGEMTGLTLGIVARTLFSADVEADKQQAMQAMKAYSHSLNLRFRSPIPLPDWIPTPQNRAQRRVVQTMDALLERIISQRRASGLDNGDLLSMLLESVDEDGVTRLTDRQVRDEVLTMFFAGHETTSNALAWAWYLLAEHPEAQEKLRAELAEVLGERAPTMQDMPRLPYLSMVVKEILRLYPPAWLFDREPVQPVEIGGYHIPKGRTIFISPYVVHRDPRYFEQPERFWPERFADGFEASLPRCAYVPFGSGARICIGQAFAQAEVSVILATMLPRVRLLRVDEQEIVPEAAATLTPKGGLRMRVER